MEYPTNRLIIWRSLVQAQAGPRFYYSDLRFGVGRCFWFMWFHSSSRFQLRQTHTYYLFINLRYMQRFDFILLPLQRFIKHFAMFQLCNIAF